MTIVRLISLLMFTAFFSTGFTQSYISKTIQYDSETREYDIYVPAVYNGTSQVPLIFNFHGGGGDIAGQIAIADMSLIADTANFIVVYPQALPDPNDGGPTNWIHKDPTNVDDVYFIDALIDSLSLDYQIDPTRIYACGYSLGGEFSYEVGCRLNNRIASIAAVARTMGVYQLENCLPMHPTGVLTILGTEDPISNYNGVWWGGIQYYLSADEVHEYWINHNNCNAVPIVTPLPDIDPGDGSTVERYSWANAASCIYVEHLKVLGGGHDWPGSFGNMDIDASEEIWKFVSKYDLNGLIGCVSNSIDASGINAQGIEIFPNPSNGFFNIQINSSDHKDYTLYSSKGQIILAGILHTGNTIIDVRELPIGVYVIKLKTDSETKTEKIIIQ